MEYFALIYEKVEETVAFMVVGFSGIRMPTYEEMLSYGYAPDQHVTGDIYLIQYCCYYCYY